MNGPGILLAWSLSLLPILIESASGGAIGFPEASKLGLVLLPWIALAGLPHEKEREKPAERSRDALLTLVLALPPVALGAGLDVAAATSTGAPSEPYGTLSIAALVIVCWRAAADRKGSRTRALQGGLWTALVPGAAALHVALLWVPRGTRGASNSAADGMVSAALEWIGRTNPLVWIARWTADRSPDPWGGLGAASIALSVWLLVSLVDRREVREGIR